jgi:hypothetical protein
MESIKSLFVFIFWVVLFLCIAGTCSIISCLRSCGVSPNQNSNSEIYSPKNYPVEVPIIDNYPTDTPVKYSTTKSINWVPFNKKIKSKIKNKEDCLFLYFDNSKYDEFFEGIILRRPSLVNKINDNFLAVKIPNRKNIYTKLGINVYPTIMLLSKSGKSTKVEGHTSASDIISIINKPEYTTCR